MATIKSNKKWNDTGVDLTEDHAYNYKATGQWKDCYITCDADGFSNPLINLFGWTKRIPSARWFQLIGAIDKNKSYTINLGKEGEFIAPTSGRLWVYANDAEFTYGNNFGALELHIRAV